MGLTIHLRRDIMDFMEISWIIYLIGNGLLQLYFVKWILWRNEKLTFLLSEYYKNH